MDSALNALVAKWFAFADSNPRRTSLGPEGNVVLSKNTDIGDHMPFVNREDSCFDVAIAFAKMREFVKTKGKLTYYDRYKSKVVVVLCEGISGLGKSRMARVAMEQAVNNKNHRRCSELYELWPTVSADVINSINIRIDCTDLFRCTPETVEHTCSVEILFQWLKYNLREEFGSNLSLAHDQFASDCAHLSIRLTTVLNLLYQTGRCVFINFDEAQRCNNLTSVLSLYARTVFEFEAQIFVTFTGLQGNNLQSVIDQSSCRPISITLAPLDERHMVEIIETAFPGVHVNIWLRYLLNCFTGVVKYLAEALVQVTHICRYDADTVVNYFNRFSHKEAVEVYNSVKQSFGTSLVNSQVPVDAVLNLLAFVVGGVVVLPGDLDRNLSGIAATTFTFRDAQREQLCYLSSGGGDGYTVVVPMMALSCYYQSARHSSAMEFPIIFPALHNTGFSVPRDNEALLLTVMKNREQCYLVLGRSSVKLSELLGVPLPTADDHTILIDRKHSRKLAVSSATVTASSLPGHRGTVIDSDGNIKPGAKALAFINKNPTAAVADGWAYYLCTDDNHTKYPVTVLIQEKQSVVARDQVISDGKPPIQHTAEDISKEYRNCQAGDSNKFLFVFATDSATPTVNPELPHTVLLFSGNLLERALGRIAWFTRKHQLAASNDDFLCGDRSKRVRDSEQSEADNVYPAAAKSSEKRAQHC